MDKIKLLKQLRKLLGKLKDEEVIKADLVLTLQGPLFPVKDDQFDLMGTVDKVIRFDYNVSLN